MTRVPAAFSCSREFLDLVDARAASLNMNRSQYITQVLRLEITSGNPSLNIVAENSTVHGDIHIANHHKPDSYKIARKRKPSK